MTPIVQGAFNKLLKPGLMEAFYGEYDVLNRWAEDRTGVTQTWLGVPTPLRGVDRRPLYEEEPYPPTDWPDYP